MRYGRLEFDGSVMPFCRRTKPHIRPLSMVQIFARFQRICQRIAWGVA